jgi:hypothetical protein
MVIVKWYQMPAGEAGWSARFVARFLNSAPQLLDVFKQPRVFALPHGGAFEIVLKLQPLPAQCLRDRFQLSHCFVSIEESKRFASGDGGPPRRTVERLRGGAMLATLCSMSVQVDLSEELAAKIDDVATNRSAFVAEAVRRLLHDSLVRGVDETARINELADELNREAEEVLEYQVIS